MIKKPMTKLFINYKGEKISVADCSKLTGISKQAIRIRILSGLPDYKITQKPMYLRASPKALKILSKLRSNLAGMCHKGSDPKYKYYGGKGIKNYLTREDLLLLWNRDWADLLKQPSLDRIDGTKDYTIDNCQFIEMNDNRRKRTYDMTIKKSLQCFLCKAVWTPRKKMGAPVQCPRCKRVDYRRPKK